MSEPAEHYRVLLVEDNELDARSLIRSLTTQGSCEVDRVADLTSGLAAVERDAFDAVLLDLSLPDSDGLVSVETMVARAKHCPVVVLTGLDDPEVAVQAVARGAQDYLVKSTITAELVVRSIRYAVARHSTETELVDARQRLHTMHAREQIARDLHDTVIQRLYATGLTLQAASRLDDPEQVRARVSTTVEEIDAAIRELREAIFGLHTVGPAEAFAVEIEQLADDFRDALGFELGIRLGELRAVGEGIRSDALAVIREALSNVARHADASAATLTVSAEADELVVRVVDNGRGPAGGAVTDKSARKASGEGSGNGMPNMAARAEMHGGSLVVRAPAQGGCELSWSVPISPGPRPQE